MDQKELIHEFDRSPSEQIKFTCSEFEGKKYYHIRTYVRSVDYNTNEVKWFPTKKGISFTLEEFPNFTEGMIKLKEYIERSNS